MRSETGDSSGSPVYLIPNKTVYSEMNPHQVDSFLVKMKAGQFASIRFTEKKIRLYALVYDPLDSVIQIKDENGIGNNEIINLSAQITGDYKIKLMWGFTKPLTGQYSITLDKLESIGKTPAQRARQLFESWYEKNEPGGAVAVIQNGKVVYQGIKGTGNMDDRQPLTDSSVFEIASTSKQFTGFAIAMLVDQKKISLDDDIRKYLPEMPEYGAKISIANLVHHTSGIRNSDVLQLIGITNEDITTLPMMVKFASSQKKLKFTPGEKFSYSNPNYNLLAEIVARVTGESFPSWMKKNVFIPLKMFSTFSKEDPGQVYANKVLSYNASAKGFTQLPSNFAAIGSAAICTTIHDLILWVNSFETKQLITPGMETLLQTTGILNDGNKVYYIFGNEWGPYQTYKRIQHLGLVIGFRTGIARFPDQKLAVIYLSNDNNDASYARFTAITDLFLPAVKQPRVNIKRIPKPDAILKQMEKEEKGEPDIDFSMYEGTYFSEELFGSIQIKDIGGKLVVRHYRMKDINLPHSKGDNFGFVQFNRDSTDKVISMRFLPEDLDLIKVGMDGDVRVKGR